MQILELTCGVQLFGMFVIWHLIFRPILEVFWYAFSSALALFQFPIGPSLGCLPVTLLHGCYVYLFVHFFFCVSFCVVFCVFIGAIDMGASLTLIFRPLVRSLLSSLVVSFCTSVHVPTANLEALLLIRLACLISSSSFSTGPDWTP